MEPGSLDKKLDALLDAISEVDRPVVFTAPNADPGGELVLRRIEAHVASRPRAVLVPTLGADDFAALMARSAALVGNSSAGIIEAATFGLPVVNIGQRQDGRVRAANVIDVGYHRDEIGAAIRRAIAPDFRAGLDGMVNPYDAGGAAERIVDRLATEELGLALLQKHFIDLS
jgi:UDP-N-acetylglucosamine 2-epimerase